MTNAAKFLVSTCIVPCNDLPKTRDFYVDLGFEIRHEQTDYVILRKDEVSLHVTFSEGWYIDPKLNNTQIRIETDNVDALYAKCQELDIVHPNGPLELKPWGSKEFTILDPDNACIALYQEMG